MKSATIMITRPRRDNDPTVYTFEWGGEIVKIARDLEYQVIDIQKDETSYDNVSNMIKKYRPRVFIHAGHGCEWSIEGQSGCEVTRKFGVDELMLMMQDPNKIEMVKRMLNPLCGINNQGICQNLQHSCSTFCEHPTNINLLKGSIVIPIACYTAKQLGDCSIKYGIETFVGERDLLMFPVDSIGSQNMFGDVQITFIRELLLGHTVEEAEATMRKLEDSYIRKNKNIKYLSLPMLWNQLNRRIIGNSEAMIYE